MGYRYSKYYKPISLFLDFSLIIFTVVYISDIEFLNLQFLTFILLFWLFSSLLTGFYSIKRSTKSFQLIRTLLSQLTIFTLGYFSYFGIFKEGQIVNNQTKILLIIVFLIAITKLLAFYGLRIYRAYGNNYRKSIVIGGDSSSKRIIDTLKEDKELGYQFLGFFSNKPKQSKDYLGDIGSSFSYILKNEIDEIFCSLAETSELELKKIKKFASENNKVLKLIPNSKEIFNKDIKSEFYGNSLLVLNLKKLPLEIDENRILKRCFDIFFSIFVIVFIFSWLFPILILLIRIESKGSAIFKQKREGFLGEEFTCYKFRSMYKSKKVDEGHTQKNDTRITKIGAFLRKTSLDELPQFFNVFLGTMSVVGPRPHMNVHSLKFDSEVRNYMKRKSVKPGITGLAQISGYRGEIKKKSDIENRVRFDVFYIENWSFMLDVKIIVQTFLNVFKGDVKAY